MKITLILIIICSWTKVQAQFLDKLAVSAEYRYLGRNIAGLGLEYRASNKDEAVLNIGAKVFYTTVKRKAKILPQINIECGNFLNGGVSITPYAIEPQFIINVLNLIKLNTGYAIPIHQEKYFKGITFGLQINIAVGKYSRFYDDLKVGF